MMSSYQLKESIRWNFRTRRSTIVTTQQSEQHQVELLCEFDHRRQRYPTCFRFKHQYDGSILKVECIFNKERYGTRQSPKIPILRSITANPANCDIIFAWYFQWCRKVIGCSVINNNYSWCILQDFLSHVLEIINLTKLKMFTG